MKENLLLLHENVRKNERDRKTKRTSYVTFLLKFQRSLLKYTSSYFIYNIMY